MKKNKTYIEIKGLNKTERECLITFVIELNKAKIKNPIWPNDIILQSSIVCEEIGGIIKEANNIKSGSKCISQAYNEGIHSMITAFRFLTNLKF